MRFPLVKSIHFSAKRAPTLTKSRKRSLLLPVTEPFSCHYTEFPLGSMFFLWGSRGSISTSHGADAKRGFVHNGPFEESTRNPWTRRFPGGPKSFFPGHSIEGPAVPQIPGWAVQLALPDLQFDGRDPRGCIRKETPAKVAFVLGFRGSHRFAGFWG